MGKARRNRGRKVQRNEPKRTAANTSTSAGGRGGAGERMPSYFDGIAEQDLDNMVDAWGLINVYLQLTTELDDTYPVPDKVSAQDPVAARQLAEGLAGLRPHAVLGLRDDAAFFASRVTDVVTGTKAILAEPRAWLRETRFAPDLREWFAGASGYASLMVGDDAERDAVLALLDYDSLMDGSDSVGRMFGVPEQATATLPPLFSLEDLGPGNRWLHIVRETGGTAGLHAAASLALWLFGKPGAIKNPNKKLIALASRGRDAFLFLSDRDGHR